MLLLLLLLLCMLSDAAVLGMVNTDVIDNHVLLATMVLTILTGWYGHCSQLCPYTRHSMA